VLGSSSGVVPEDSPIIAILANVAPFGPALAAVVAAIGKRTGLRQLLGSLDPRRIDLRWYLLALFGPSIAIVSASIVGVLLVVVTHGRLGAPTTGAQN